MSKVKLTTDKLPETREFDIEHAQKLLDYQRKNNLNDWKLDDNLYTLEDGIIKPVESIEGAEKHGSNSKSNKPSAKA